MRILALETIGQAGSVAALEDHNLLASISLGPMDRSAKALVPAIHSLWREVGWAPSDVQLIAVAVGPGSFTGLRVGITTAKTLAFALGAEVIGVHSLEVIAWQVPEFVGRLSVWMDAQRQQVFASTYECKPGERPQCLIPARILDNETALASLTPNEWVTGPALKKLAPSLPATAHVVEAALWDANAVAIGELAWSRYAAGERNDFWKLAPLYLRQSAAEEKWEREHRP